MQKQWGACLGPDIFRAIVCTTDILRWSLGPTRDRFSSAADRLSYRIQVGQEGSGTKKITYTRFGTIGIALIHCSRHRVGLEQMIKRCCVNGLGFVS